MSAQINRLILLFGSILALTLFSSGIALAETPTQSLSEENMTTESENSPFELPNCLEDVGDASIKQSLNINGHTYQLLPTFNDKVSALNAISSETDDILSILQEVYELDALSDKNWSDYKAALESILSDNAYADQINESNQNVYKLRAFFDIYENDDDNAQMLELAEEMALSNAGSTDISSAETMEEITSLLPDQSVLSNSIDNDSSTEAKSENKDISTASLSSSTKFNISNAVSYALKYAVNYNKSSYEYLRGADCTNFASQILYAGGVKQRESIYIDKTWWHKKKTVSGKTKHSYSSTWINAHNFTRFAGIDFKTNSILYFSKNLKKGDFIAGDWASDGKWDHLGFVVAKSNKNVGGYYNFRVAQHTTNYLAWASSSTNEWEKAGKNGGTYGRMRISG